VVVTVRLAPAQRLMAVTAAVRMLPGRSPVRTLVRWP